MTVVNTSINVADRRGQTDNPNNPHHFNNPNISNFSNNRNDPTTLATFASASKTSSAGTPEQSVPLNNPATSGSPVLPFRLCPSVSLGSPVSPFLRNSPVLPAGSLTPTSLITPVSLVPLPSRNHLAPILVLTVQPITTVLSASLDTSVQPVTLGQTVPRTSQGQIDSPDQTVPRISQGRAVLRDPNGPAYNPFEHRHVRYPTSVMSAIINLMKACLGTGILAMPSAYKNAGLLLGTLGVLMAGSIVTHAIHILVKTSQELCIVAEKPHMSFAETCGAAFTHGPRKLKCMGHFIENLADISLVLCYTGVLCIYVVFIAASLKEVIDGLFNTDSLSTMIYALLIHPALVLICQIRSLKFVTPFSAIANVGIFTVFAITMFFVFSDLPSPTERDMVAPIAQWPFFISIAVFAIEGIGVVMPVEYEMAHPEKFLGCPGVLNITMSTVVVLYGFVGFMGYLKYGNDVKGSITLSLPQDSFVALFTKFLMAVVIFLTYTLQFYVPMEAITRRLDLEEMHRHYNLVQIGVRTAIVTITVFVAILVPNLEIVITLVGSIFFSTCGILLPVVTETVWRWDKNLGPYKYVLVKNLTIFCIGIVTMISGSTSALVGIKDVKHSEYFGNV